MAKLALDFTIHYDEDRVAFLHQYITPENEFSFNSIQLEKMADYILYGKKKETEKSHFQPDPFYLILTPNKIEEPIGVSLDALLENPDFQESSLKKPTKNFFRGRKTSIDRELDKDIPGMQQTWESIDYLATLLEKSIANKATSKTIAIVRKMLIDFQRKQYVLKYEMQPKIARAYLLEDVYNADPVDFSYDMDFLSTQNGKRTNRKMIDLSNPAHLKEIVENYDQLYYEYSSTANSGMLHVLWGFDSLLKSNRLPPAFQDFIEQKKMKKDHNSIAQELRQKYGRIYTRGYLSQMYIKALKSMAELAKQIYKENKLKNQEFRWQVCPGCGQKKLLNSYNFYRKEAMPTGYETKCKNCTWSRKRKDI